MKRVLFWHWWWGRFIAHCLYYMAPKLLILRHLNKKYGPEKAEQEAFKTVQKWADRCVKSGKHSFTVNGLEKVPKDRPVLFVSNHESYGDIPMIIHALKGHNVGFVLKSTMLGIPFIGDYLKYMHCVPLDQSNMRSASKSINIAAEEIEKGYSLVIFPEGKRSFNNFPAEFKNGAFKIAMKTGVTIVPIYLHNVHYTYEGNGCMVTPADVTVNILDPIETGTLTRADMQKLSEKVYKIIWDFAEEFNAEYNQKN